MPDRFKGHLLPAVFYAYPLETMLATAMIPAGLLQALPPYPYPPQYGGEPMFWLSLACGLAFVISGIITLIGLGNWQSLWHGGIEQLGLWLTAGSLVLFTINLNIALSPFVLPVTGTLTLSLAVACIIRARAIRIIAAQRLDRLRTANQLREETGKHGTVGR